MRALRDARALLARRAPELARLGALEHVLVAACVDLACAHAEPRGACAPPSARLARAADLCARAVALVDAIARYRDAAARDAEAVHDDAAHEGDPFPF